MLLNLKTFFQKRKHKFALSFFWLSFCFVTYSWPATATGFVFLLWVCYFFENISEYEQDQFKFSVDQLKKKINAESDEQAISFCSTIANSILHETELGADCVIRYPDGSEKILVGGEYQKND